ncbi:hypothetical protein HHUSO_G5660 [Huso huso]|uniref:Uncharacterized protein n=1 Tax=Huso huso TaxID=61971 RepID=A0ABR1A1L1_HUSHU
MNRVQKVEKATQRKGTQTIKPVEELAPNLQSEDPTTSQQAAQDWNFRRGLDLYIAQGTIKDRYGSAYEPITFGNPD